MLNAALDKQLDWFWIAYAVFANKILCLRWQILLFKACKKSVQLD